MFWASQVALVVKNPPANVGDVRDTGSIPGTGSSPAGGHGNPLQYSCLENPMDRGAWWATVHRVTKSWARLKQLGTHARVLFYFLCFYLIIYTGDFAYQNLESCLSYSFSLPPTHCVDVLLFLSLVLFDRHLGCGFCCDPRLVHTSFLTCSRCLLSKVPEVGSLGHRVKTSVTSTRND